MHIMPIPQLSTVPQSNPWSATPAFSPAYGYPGSYVAQPQFGRVYQPAPAFITVNDYWRPRAPQQDIAETTPSSDIPEGPSEAINTLQARSPVKKVDAYIPGKDDQLGWLQRKALKAIAWYQDKTRIIDENGQFAKHNKLMCSCPFSPSCSTYTAESIRKYGALKGSLHGLKHILLHCNPFYVWYEKGTPFVKPGSIHVTV